MDVQALHSETNPEQRHARLLLNEVEDCKIRRVALRVTGVRPGAAHDETLVTLGSDIVADGAVASHAAGVRHEHARLARDVGAEVPGMGGERK